MPLSTRDLQRRLKIRLAFLKTELRVIVSVPRADLWAVYNNLQALNQPAQALTVAATYQSRNTIFS